MPAEQPRLIVVRGNSGSGKSSVATALRTAFGRGIAVVGQDNIRRTILRDRDRPGTANIGLIGQVARYSLEHGFHVVVEGILDASRYGPMLAELSAAHCGPSHFYYLDVSLDETIRRHATRPQAAEFGPADMRDWYLRLDLLPCARERVIGEASTLRQTVDLILAETGLLEAVLLRAESAARSDIPSWLELAAEVEPLFGPMPRLADHIERGIDRGTALVVRDPREVVLGAALLSAAQSAPARSAPAWSAPARSAAGSGDGACRDDGRRIRWLAVRGSARRRGVATTLLTEIVRRCPPRGSLAVETFGPAVPGAEAARRLYRSFGFEPAAVPPAWPGGESRQLFVLRRS